MKAILFFALFVSIGSMAQAVPLQIHDVIQKALPSAFKSLSGNPGSGPGTPLAPIRQATAKVRIQKWTYVKVGTDYDQKIEEICEMTGSVNVFDARGVSDPMYAVSAPASCTSTVGGLPASVHVFALVFLTGQQVFISEPPSDLKVFVASLYVSVSPSLPDPAKPIFDNSFAITRDLSQKSALLSLLPSNVKACTTDVNGTTCEVERPEIFSAIVEITD